MKANTMDFLTEKMTRKNSGGYDQRFFQRISEVEDKHFWFSSRNCLIRWVLKRYARKAVNFLEIGCGTGFVLSGLEQEFPQLPLTGCDIYPEALIFSGERLSRTRLLLADVRGLPFRSVFSLIGAFDVLEHIEDDSKVLNEINLSLGRHGKLILSVPQHKSAWSNVDLSASHVRRYAAKELKKKLENSGFEILESFSFVFLLFPAVMFWRIVGESLPIFHRKAVPELDIPPVLNFILQRIMDLELFFIRCGVRFPCGASLLIVAQKR